ncbi:MAG: response regulator [Opitutaceae bacterium]|nr:response regulator [Opitutaceae bacterium]
MPSILDLSVRLKTKDVAVPRQPARVLVVDDDPLILQLEATILRRAGHHVDIAKDGECGWQALLAARYDLLVTDCQMPRMSGLDLVLQLRAAQMTLPVIMASGSLESLNIETLTHAPSRIHAFVRKPFTISQLLGAVKSALEPSSDGDRSPQMALG